MLLKEVIANQALTAKAASRIMAGISAETKNSALLKMADAL